MSIIEARLEFQNGQPFLGFSRDAETGIEANWRDAAEGPMDADMEAVFGTDLWALLQGLVPENTEGTSGGGSPDMPVRIQVGFNGPNEILQINVRCVNGHMPRLQEIAPGHPKYDPLITAVGQPVFDGLKALDPVIPQDE